MRLQVAYKDTGEIVAVDIEFIGNAGWNLDYSGAVIGKALSNMDATYRIPNLRFKGRMARTNTCSNTAMRGLGAPQACPHGVIACGSGSHQSGNGLQLLSALV